MDTVRIRQIRPVLLALLLSLGMAAAEEDGARARGRRYVERLAAAWAKEPPREMLFGLYMGRVWQGSLHVVVRPIGRDGGAWELTQEIRGSALGRWYRLVEKTILTASLGVLSSNRADTVLGETTRTWVHREDRGWRVGSGEEGDGGFLLDGDPDGGDAWNPMWLPLFGCPAESDLNLSTAGNADRTARMEILPDKQRRAGAGQSVEPTILLVQGLDSNDGHYHPCRTFAYDSDGRFVEMRSGEFPFRAIPILPGFAGHDIDATIELAEPQQVVVKWLRALARRDKESFVACWDLEGELAESPAYQAMAPEERAKRLDERRRDLEKILEGPEPEGRVPDSQLEDYVWSLAYEAEADEAGVGFGHAVLQLHRVKEGKDAGKWLMYQAGIE